MMREGNSVICIELPNEQYYIDNKLKAGEIYIISDIQDYPRDHIHIKLFGLDYWYEWKYFEHLAIYRKRIIDDILGI